MLYPSHLSEEIFVEASARGARWFLDGMFHPNPPFET